MLTEHRVEFLDSLSAREKALRVAIANCKADIAFYKAKLSRHKRLAGVGIEIDTRNSMDDRHRQQSCDLQRKFLKEKKWIVCALKREIVRINFVDMIKSPRQSPIRIWKCSNCSNMISEIGPMPYRCPSCGRRIKEWK